MKSACRNPLFEGDTVYSRSEVLEKRESKSRPNVGIVKVQDHRLQAGRRRGDRVPAHVHGLQARSRAGDRARDAAFRTPKTEVSAGPRHRCRRPSRRGRAADRRSQLQHSRLTCSMRCARPLRAKSRRSGAGRSSSWCATTRSPPPSACPSARTAASPSCSSRSARTCTGWAARSPTPSTPAFVRGRRPGTCAGRSPAIRRGG